MVYKKDAKIDYDQCGNIMYETTQGDINSLLEYRYGVQHDRLPSPENKPSARGDTDKPIYKETWERNGIYHRRTSGFQKGTENLMG